MPRAPKTEDARQRRNVRGVAAVPKPRVTCPAPPERILAKTRQQWEAFWASELARTTVMETDMPALERLFSLYDDRERAHRSVQRQRFIQGSQGQPVVNPMSRLIPVFDGEIRQLEDRFGLMPMARLKLGVKFGQAADSLDDLNKALSDDEDETDPRLQAVTAD